MSTCNVLHTMVIGNNTAVVVDCRGEKLRNGIGIKDENGQTYKLLSVGMDGGSIDKSSFDKTSLLIEGSFSSKRIIV